MENMIAQFKHEVNNATEETFHSSVCSFLNLWNYEYGSFEHLPNEIHHLLHISQYDILTVDYE
ncbi:hypothetical protein NSR00_16600 [Aeribacillus sp. FSL K6-8394]|mgnify:FL=1|uniref:hypothetical protein n=1 Tax=Aeribacillus sp. FSL K6-8394 TaxID=2954570 RepID=UPI0030F87C5A